MEYIFILNNYEVDVASKLIFSHAKNVKINALKNGSYSFFICISCEAVVIHRVFKIIMLGLQILICNSGS